MNESTLFLCYVMFWVKSCDSFFLGKTSDLKSCYKRKGTTTSHYIINTRIALENYNKNDLQLNNFYLGLRAYKDVQ